MSAAKFSINVTGNDDEIPIDSTPESLQKFINYITSALSGSRLDTVTFDVRNNQVAASGTVTIATGSGTITATINGVAVDVTWATSDTATAAALAAAINAEADSLVADLVSATSNNGVVTILAKVPGKAGNAITLSASGTGATASGARLEGGDEDDLITHTV